MDHHSPGVQAAHAAHDHGTPASEHPAHKRDACQTACCFIPSQLPPRAPEPERRRVLLRRSLPGRGATPPRGGQMLPNLEYRSPCSEKAVVQRPHRRRSSQRRHARFTIPEGAMHPKSNRRIATRTFTSHVIAVMALAAALSFTPLGEASAQHSGHHGHHGMKGTGRRSRLPRRKRRRPRSAVPSTPACMARLLTCQRRASSRSRITG